MRRIRAVAMAVCASVAVGLTFLGAGPVVAADPVVVDDPVGAGQLLVLANADRAAAGLAPLELRSDVYDIAVAHSRRMAVAGDIFHNDDYFTADVRQRLGARSLGENVALNTSMDDAHKRLMNSPGHRANLLNPKFTVVGMAVVRTVDGVGFITQDFVEPVAPRPAPLAPSPDPQPAPAPPSDGGSDAGTPAPAPSPAVSPGSPAAGPATSPAPIPAAAPTAAAPMVATAAAGPEAVASTTTTARELVSVVTEPISASETPPSATEAGRSTPVVLISVAFALLAMVATETLRTLRRKGQPDFGV